MALMIHDALIKIRSFTNKQKDPRERENKSKAAPPQVASSSHNLSARKTKYHHEICLMNKLFLE